MLVLAPYSLYNNLNKSILPIPTHPPVVEVCFGSSEFIFLSANTKYPCLQRQRDQEATKLSLLDLTLHLGSIELLQYVWWITQDGFKVFICHYSLEDFFVFESYIFEERCEWPLARDQQKAGKRIRHVEKKIRSCVCCSNSFAPKN